MNQELNKRKEIDDVLKEILQVSSLHASLEQKLEAVLLLILEIPWLSLEQKGCIYLAKDDAPELQMVVDHNLSASLLNMCKLVKFGQCLCGKAALEKQLIFRDCIDDAHSNHPAGMTPHGHYNVPIMHDGDVLGVINLYVKHGHSALDLEKTFLTMVADVLATIIINELVLQAEKDDNRGIIAIATDSFITINTEGIIQKANQATEKIFGYTADELVGNNVNMLMRSHESSQHDKYLSEYIKTNSAGIMGTGRDLKAKHKDGHALYIHLELTELKSKGMHQLFNGVITDITGTKAQQQALFDSEARYKALFEDSADAVLILKSKHFTGCNEAAVRALGYDNKQEIINLHPSELSPPTQPDGRDSVEKANEVIATAFEKGSHRFEWAHTHKSGKAIPFEVLLTSMLVDGEKVLHAAMRDITVSKAQQQALLDSESRYKSLFEESIDPVLIIKDGVYVDCNEATVYAFGFDGKQDLLDTHPWELSPPTQPDGRDSVEKGSELLAITLEKGSHRFEWTLLHKSGKAIPVEVSHTVIMLDGEQIIHSTWRDMSESKAQQQALLDSEARYKALFEDSADAVSILQGNRYIDCNEAAVRMLGYDNKQEMLRLTPRILFPPSQADGRDSLEKAKEEVATAYEKGSNRLEWEYLHKNGTVISVEILLTAMSIDGEQVLHCVWRDISQLKKQQTELQRLAHYDSLTGLPNRTLFADRFVLAAAHSKRSNTQLAVCFLDLDNFKPINDNFGHDVGDILLMEVAKRITDSIREEDTVSRQGGDEFTLLLGGLESYQECEQLIGRMLKSLAQPYMIKGETHAVTASCGITLYPDDKAADIDTLVRHADQAMYQAKLHGKNAFVFFDSSTEAASQEHIKFTHRVSQAVRDNEMALYYQPKVNMHTGDMFGAEALIRWQHPDKGLIAPFGFLPQIEKSPVMVDVGNWVIEQALQQIETWGKAGKSWVISINIDAHHFMQESFYEDLKQSLANHPNVPPELLEIEILETVAFDDLQSVSALILRCQLLGVSFALDDFGTGYSSLAYLKHLPVEWLKIDQSFIRDMLEDEEDLALVDGIISLSKAFKRQVIAEGVETIQHGTELLKLGCLNAQGYGIAKPMPADELIAWEEGYQVDEAWKE